MTYASGLFLFVPYASAPRDLTGQSGSPLTSGSEMSQEQSSGMEVLMIPRL